MVANETSADGADPNDYTVESDEEMVEHSGIVDLFATPSNAKIFNVMHSSMPMNAHDIAERAAISRHAFYENRETLLEYGVIEEAGTVGNSTMYTLADNELVTYLKRVNDLASARKRELEGVNDGSDGTYMTDDEADLDAE